jgi:glycosyltransferase involved in cell wall biosynthesis
MKIGIDASRAFFGERTGIEEYSYQVIRNLAEPRHCLGSARVVLYVRKNQEIDFNLPEKWKIRIIKFPFLWTQVGLSLEMLFHSVDILFVPAHVLPVLSPKKSMVVIHGLEYETFPQGYSFWERLYMRWSIKFSSWKAEKIIAVSKNTKKDLIEFYKVPEEKIEVVYEGVKPMRNYETNANLRTARNEKYLLFIGRLEKRKNIEGILKAFEILKEKYKIPHKLILVGKPGFRYQSIKDKIENSKYKADIIETGYINEEEKYDLLKNADVFLFPSFYEGFGLPVLEAQILETPVATSNVSSLPEVGGDAVAYCDPNEPAMIADAVYEILRNDEYKGGLIKRGCENVKRFNWNKCSREIAKIIMEK